MKRAVVLPCFLIALAPLAPAQIQNPSTPAAISLGLSPYTQNFDTLSLAATASTLPAGWVMSEIGSAANAT